MSKNNGSIMTDKDESILADKDTVENPYLSEIEQLLAKEKRGGNKHCGEKNTIILFIPLFIGIAVFLAAVLIFSIPYLVRSPDKIDISLVSLERMYESSTSDKLEDTYITATFAITNNGKKGVSYIDFLTDMQNGDGVTLYRGKLSFSCRYTESVGAGETRTASVKIFPRDYAEIENYSLLWNSSPSKLDTKIDLQMAEYEGGKTFLYSSSWYMRNDWVYEWILILTVSIWSGWMVYCSKKRCSACRRFNAMQFTGKRETGRQACSWTERHAWRDKYGKEVKDSKGETIYEEKRVHGYDVNYKYYHTCKYCGHEKVSRGSELKR